MTIILQEMPYYDTVTYANVDRQLVQVMPHQIIVWVSLSVRTVHSLPVSSPRFPVVLDSGNTYGFAISEKHLELWTGLTLQALEHLGSVSINRVSVPRLDATVWLHPNKKGERNSFGQRPPFRLALRDGIAVYPRAADLQAPRLPILGMRAVDENKLPVLPLRRPNASHAPNFTEATEIKVNGERLTHVGFCRSLLLHDPDVAELQRIAVPLEQDRTRACPRGRCGGRRWGRLISTLSWMTHAVELHGGPGLLRPSCRPSRHGVGEVHVVGLPDQRRQAHVHLRRHPGVNAAALVVLAVQAERVEDLHLVVIDLVEAAVAPTLAAGVGADRAAGTRRGRCSC